jgi:hypothetical protein
MPGAEDTDQEVGSVVSVEAVVIMVLNFVEPTAQASKMLSMIIKINYSISPMDNVYHVIVKDIGIISEKDMTNNGIPINPKRQTRASPSMSTETTTPQ